MPNKQATDRAPDSAVNALPTAFFDAKIPLPADAAKSYPSP